MKNQIHQQLVQLATTILEAENLSVTEIKKTAQQLYEQATILAYAEKNEISSAPIKEIKTPPEENKEAPSIVTKTIPINTTDTFDKFERTEVLEKNETLSDNIPQQEAPALLHELESLTQGFDLPDFEPLDTSTEIKSAEAETSKNDLKSVSLNDKLNTGFNVGLNDRLAFVSQLFGGNQEDYTRVISQLNTTETLVEAQQFINEIVKPEYNNWEGKETFELRFFELIERNFQ